MDVIRLVISKASNGHKYILVAIDYFTKWVEATSYKSVTQVVVAWFLKQKIIYFYGIPRKLVIDNGKNLNGKMIEQLCQQFKIEHQNSISYLPQMNGTIEVANKNKKKILVKMTNTYKDRHKFLPFALCAYHNSVGTSTSATLYSLVYGMEAILPADVEIPSLRILSQTKLLEVQWAYSWHKQLNMIDEKRITTICHAQLYQRHIKWVFNKKVKLRVFKEGDLVLKKRNQAMPDHRGKFTPTRSFPVEVRR